MKTLSINYCRVCGSDLSPEEEICTKCGGVQFFGKKQTSTVVIVLLVVAGFIAVVLLGFLSAVSIPRLSALRADARDAAGSISFDGALHSDECRRSWSRYFPA